MREILFRGQRIDNGEWVYGSLVIENNNEMYIIESKCWNIYQDGVLVKSETVSQFTGLQDKNATKIFEGDKFQGDEAGEYYIVNWNKEEAAFQMDLYGYNVSIGENSQEVFDDEISHIDSNCFELSALQSDLIIGNIHEDGK